MPLNSLTTVMVKIIDENNFYLTGYTFGIQDCMDSYYFLGVVVKFSIDELCNSFPGSLSSVYEEDMTSLSQSFTQFYDITGVISFT